MRRKIVILLVVFVSIAGCSYFVSNFPRETTKIKLDIGVEIEIEVSENSMAMMDPVVSKKITIDYGDRKLVHISDHDDYGYRIYLVKEKEDTLWILQEDDGCEIAECSFSDPKATFVPIYAVRQNALDRDTLLAIDYSDFIFTVKKY